MTAPATSGETPTRTSPARPPDGWFVGFYRYRNYVLFASTSLAMALGCAMLLFGLAALGRGADAWTAYLARLGSPPGALLTLVSLAGSVYFAIRWGWVGRKIPAGGKIGPISLGMGMPMPLLGLGPIGGFVTLWLVVLLVLGGVFP